MGTFAIPDLRAVHRVLIIRLSSIGDVIHALPVSAALGEAFPHLEITWLVEEMSAEVVTGNPYLHDVIVIPRSRWKRGRMRSPQVWREYLAFLADLRRRRFDLSLDLQGYAKSGLLALAAGAPHRFGWWRLREGAELVSRALPRRPESLHRVDWFLDAVRAFGVEPQTVRFPLDVPDPARARAVDLLSCAGIRPGFAYAVLNPSAGNPMRRWGAARYAEVAVGLAQRYGLPSVLIGSDRDISLCDSVVESVAGRASVGVLAGKTNLKELAAVLGGCAVHVCGDTGSAHMAAALGRPVVALFGPTDPAHAGPWGQSANVPAHRDLCRPDCWERRCVRASEGKGGGQEVVAAVCLEAITPEEVLDKVGQARHGP